MNAAEISKKVKDHAANPISNNGLAQVTSIKRISVNAVHIRNKQQAFLSKDSIKNYRNKVWLVINEILVFLYTGCSSRCILK